MGHSDKPLFFAGAVLCGLMLIVGFNTFVGNHGHHGSDQPVAGYSLPQEEEAEARTASAPGAENNAADVSEANSTVATADTTAVTATAAGATSSIETLVAVADANKGKKLFRRCGSCHTSKKGAAPTLGPNLHAIVGRDIGSQAAFSGYSDGMKAKGGNWTLQALSEFIENPKGYVQGTRMIFSGIKSEEKRADLLAYLKTLSD